jgi:BlaI family transcriptional regulator, penicillinase repressor
MPPRPPLPKSELEIARIVWDLKEATVRQVLDALPKDRNVEFWTVQTYLRRLKAKKYLKSRREGRTNIYSPCVSPDRVVSDVVRDFLNRVFDGQTLPLFQHLIQDQGLSNDEIDQLQETLNELRGKQP